MPDYVQNCVVVRRRTELAELDVLFHHDGVARRHVEELTSLEKLLSIFIPHLKPSLDDVAQVWAETLSVEPFPSCPIPLFPQHQASPVVLIAHV